MKTLTGFLFLALLALVPGKTAWAIPPSADASPHKVRFVTTDDHVKLEVLDWGGTGRPLVFLAGLGGTAHVFDKFAPGFTGKYHVYGITRRGYGQSDKPEPTVENYAADRLGDDVLAVIDALKLDHPVLVGHSIAGEELSSIGTRHPEKVAGLIYLDAGYAYAFYTPGNLIPLGSNLTIDANDLNRRQLQVNLAGTTPEAIATLDDMIRNGLPQLKADLVATRRAIEEQRKMLAQAASPAPQSLREKIADAVFSGEAKYTAIKAPILAIFAVPETVSPEAPTNIRAITKMQDVERAAEARRFQAGNPAAHVVLIGNSRHDVFNSNTAQVVREMNAFLGRLD
jgi:pimeloyl-ACP methyl ester carboxylesterase